MESLALPTLWLAACPAAVPPAWVGQLSAPEREWMLAIKVPQRRLQMVSARILARQALFAHFPAQSGPIQISAGDNQAPQLVGFPGVHLNLSHSRDYVACLIDTTPCGVDIERTDKIRDFEGIAAKTFTPSQCQRLQALEAKERQARFYQFWCAYEAKLKSTLEAPVLYAGSFQGYAIAAALRQGQAHLDLRLADLLDRSSSALYPLTRLPA